MILAIKYEEPTYRQTVKCIERSGVPVIYVDRNPKGVGSLSEAINRGIKLVPEDQEFVWVITNITFEKNVYASLIATLQQAPTTAAACPVYPSDHKHLQPAKFTGCQLVEVPFIEFTAPLIRTSILREFPLDEAMPYAGMDLDWSHRVRNSGHHLTSLKSVSVGHTYIRHIKNRYNVTRLRHRARKAADASTIARLTEKYGENWQDIMQYYSGIAAK